MHSTGHSGAVGTSPMAGLSEVNLRLGEDVQALRSEMNQLRKNVEQEVKQLREEICQMKAGSMSSGIAGCVPPAKAVQIE